jgi:rhodanese-related sulfurtransferase
MMKAFADGRGVPMYEVDTQTALDAAPDTIVVDVREPSEFATGTMPAARSIPAGELRTRLYELPRGATVYVLCANGARSLELVPFLRAVGYDAYSVSGGVWAWRCATEGASRERA